MLHVIVLAKEKTKKKILTLKEGNTKVIKMGNYQKSIQPRGKHTRR